jgi:spore germination protein YaaH
MKNSQDFVDKYNLTKKMDEEAGQNYVELNDTYITYKLWIEDADSMKKRADLVNELGLAGIAAWQKGFETQDIWTVLDNTLKAK